jgi:hypothetical protein
MIDRRKTIQIAVIAAVVAALAGGFLYLLRPEVQGQVRQGAIERGGISFTELTPQTIQMAETAGLAARVYNYLSVQRKIYRDEQADVAPPGLRIVYYTYSFASQLPNGGLQGIFAGLGASYSTKAIQAFRDAGLGDIAVVIEQTFKRYQKQETIVEPPLDHKIIETQLSQFIKKHPDMFKPVLPKERP